MSNHPNRRDLKAARTVLRGKFLPAEIEEIGGYTHRSPPSLAISSATCSTSRIRVALVVDTNRRKCPYDSTI